MNPRLLLPALLSLSFAFPAHAGGEVSLGVGPSTQTGGVANAARSALVPAEQNRVIAVTLAEGDTVAPNLNDLEGSGLRFIPDAEGQFRVEPIPLDWTAAAGPAVGDGFIDLQFPFPFGADNWDEVYVNAEGALTFGGSDASMTTDIRFAQLREFATRFVDATPAIVPLFRHRSSGSQFVNSRPDMAVFTWSRFDIAGDIFSFTSAPEEAEFRAILFPDGTIEFHYRTISFQDGIVGVFPERTEATPTRSLTAVDSPESAGVPGYLDLRRIDVLELPGRGVQVTIDLGGPLPTDSALAEGIHVRVLVDVDEPLMTGIDFTDPDLYWSVVGQADGTYIATGPGVGGEPVISGNTVTFNASIALPEGTLVSFFADAINFENTELGFDQSAVSQFLVPGAAPLAVDLSNATGASLGSVRYEVFHHRSIPSHTDQICTVIEDLGDHFDFIALYSQFRIDNQEAGSPMNVVQNDVDGIGLPRFSNAAAFCSQGRLQATLVQPIFIDALQATPAGEGGPDDDFDYALSQLGHEFGHRWLVNVAAATGSGATALGDPIHWIPELHAPVRYPWAADAAASTMGGGYWQDNGDGTFSRLDDNFFVPASGFSDLDLYLMGLLPAADVPDFFLVQNRQFIGTDASGAARFSGTRIDVTVDDVINQHGQRVPDVSDSQKTFNMGLVYLVAPGETPRADAIVRLNKLAGQFERYWHHVTGQTSVLTTEAAGGNEDDDGDSIINSRDDDDDGDGVLDPFEPERAASNGVPDGPSPAFSVEADSRDFSDAETRVLGAYLAYFGRPADLGGLSYWSGQLTAAGGDLSAIIFDFGNAEEFVRRFGDLSNGELLENLYAQLLGRSPDASGLAFWLAELTSGSRSLQEISLAIFEGVQGIDIDTVTNRLDFSKLYVSLLEQSRIVPLTDTRLAELINLIDASRESIDDAIAELEQRQP